jgi:hypothetical protein
MRLEIGMPIVGRGEWRDSIHSHRNGQKRTQPLGQPENKTRISLKIDSPK